MKPILDIESLVMSVMNIDFPVYPKECFGKLHQACSSKYTNNHNKKCSSSKTQHVCKHIVQKCEEEQWYKIFKPMDKRLSTNFLIKKQFELNKDILESYYLMVGKSVVLQKHGIFKEIDSANDIGFIGSQEYPGILVYASVSSDKPHLLKNLHTIFRAGNGFGKGSSNYLVKTYSYMMEKKKKIEWIIEPEEVSLTDDLLETVLLLESSERLGKWLLCRLDKMLNNAMHYSDCPDQILEAIKAWVMVQAYEDINILERYNAKLRMNTLVQATDKNKLIEIYESFGKGVQELVNRLNEEIETSFNNNSFGEMNKYNNYLAWKVVHTSKALELLGAALQTENLKIKIWKLLTPKSVEALRKWQEEHDSNWNIKKVKPLTWKEE